jgi:hypothetical protein
VHREVLATAERAADTGKGEAHLLGWQAECAADLLLVDGRAVVEQDRLVTADEEELARDAASASRRLLERSSR